MERRDSGLAPAHGEIIEVDAAALPEGLDPARDTVFVAGDFNGWQAAIMRT